MLFRFPADAGSHGVELVFDVLITAIKVVDALDGRGPLGGEPGEHERGAGAEIRSHDRSPGKALDELGRKSEVQVFSRPFDVDFQSVPSLQSKSVAVQFAEARSGDAVIVNPPAAWADRLNLRAQVSAVGEVTLFAGNASASSFDPAVAQVAVTLLRSV